MQFSEKETIMKMETSITKFYKQLSTREGTPVYRMIDVKVVNGKKIPTGEKNNMSLEEIKSDRGTGNTVSGYLKYIKNLYVIDFDTKDLDGCELKEFLDEEENLFTETKKGYHYYIFIKNMIPYTNQQKVGVEDFDIDLIKKNNIWETKTRKINGNVEDIKTYQWNDIKEWFDEKKMRKGEKEDKPERKITPREEPSFDNEKFFKQIDDSELKKLKKAVKFLDVKRATEYQLWLELGMALYNGGENCDDKTFDIWDNFSKQSESYPGASELMKKWYSFGNSRKDVLTISSVYHWLKIDNPEKFAQLFGGGENKYKEWFEEGRDVFVKEMNKEVMFYPAGDSFIFLVGDDFLIKKQSTARLFYAEFTFIVSISDKKKKKINPFDEWIESKNRRIITDLVFRPNDEKCKPTEFNLWKGYDYENTGDYDEEAVQPFLDHIFNIWANGRQDDYEYILNWFAHIIQIPWVKTQTCLAMQSEEGVGKGIILDLISQIIGKKYYLSSSKIESVLGRFNKSIERKILINLNETTWGGQKDLEGKFKALITDATVEIEKKGIDAYDIDNYANVIITTNEDWIVPIKGHSRRFYLLECSRDQKPSKYYEKLLAVPIQDLANFFYSRDITNANLKIRKTDLFKDQLTLNMDSVELFWYAIIKGDIIIPLLPDDPDKKITLDKSSIYELYLENANGKYNHTVNNVHFWRKVRKLIPDAQLKNATRSRGGVIRIKSWNHLVTSINFSLFKE